MSPFRDHYTERLHGVGAVMIWASRSSYVVYFKIKPNNKIITKLEYFQANIRYQIWTPWHSNRNSLSTPLKFSNKSTCVWNICRSSNDAIPAWYNPQFQKHFLHSQYFHSFVYFLYFWVFSVSKFSNS